MRDAIRAEISAIEPLDDLERDQIADTLSWVDSGAELCRVAKPATPPKHLIAYFAVVDRAHILLVDHKNAQLWLPAGGHVEPGEHPRQTVQREAKEELGCVLAHPVGAPLMLSCATTVGLTPGHIDVALWYVLPGKREQEVEFDQGEFNAVRWFEFDALPLGRSEPHMARFLNKLALIPHPGGHVPVAAKANRLP